MVTFTEKSLTRKTSVFCSVGETTEISPTAVFKTYRSSHRRCSVKKGVLKNFTEFVGKHLCPSLFLNKVAGSASNFIKKETLAQVFSCEFCKIFENIVLKEYLRWLLLTLRLLCVKRNVLKIFFLFCYRISDKILRILVKIQRILVLQM